MANNKVQLANGTVLIDITDTTAIASDVAVGKYFYNASGVKTAGTASTGGSAVIVRETNQDGGEIVHVYSDNTIELAQTTAVASDVASGKKFYNAGGTLTTGTYTPTVPNLQAKTGINPTESSQTVQADSGYDGLSSVQINAVPSSYVGSSIDRRSSSDLTSSGAIVTVPAGYYAESASKSIPSGSTTTPATSITANPTISVNATGLITATASASKSVTPTVSAGYISSGTAGQVSVSGSSTQQLSTQAAITITPTKSQQTAVASGKYTTGAVTVAAIPAAYQDVTGVTAAAGDVVSGKDIVNSSGTLVHGSLVVQHYYTGSGTPSSSLGVDGDIYLKTGA